MPIISEEKRKRNSLFLVLIVLLLGVSSIIFYQGFLKNRPQENFIPKKLVEGIPAKLFGEETSFSPTNLKHLDTIELDRKIFNDQRFVSLEINGSFPIAVSKEEVGRSNPFLPFSF